MTAGLEPLDRARGAEESASWEIEAELPGDDGSQIRLALETTTEPDPLLAGPADVGDRLVDVNGKPGLQKKTTGSVYWVPREGVLARLDHKGGDLEADLLGAAESVHPVDPDDPALRELLR